MDGEEDFCFRHDGGLRQRAVLLSVFTGGGGILFYHTESEFSGYFHLRYAGFREISFFCLWGCGAEGSHIRDSPGFGSVLPAAVSAGPGGGDLVYAFAAFIAVVCGAVMVVLQIRAEEL